MLLKQGVSRKLKGTPHQPFQQKPKIGKRLSQNVLWTWDLSIEMNPCAKGNAQVSWETYVNRNTASIDQKKKKEKKLQNERLLDPWNSIGRKWA